MKRHPKCNPDPTQAILWPGRGLPRRYLLLLIFSLALFLPAMLPAQNNGRDSLGRDDGEFEGDTLATDSPKVKKVKIKTDWLDPVALMNGYAHRQDADFKLDELMYPDFIDRAGGFATTLGQWGKPYQRYRYGTEASNFEQGHYVNPINGNENVYFLDPQYEMRYYDTRTPYVNAYYAQGKADAAQLRIDVAQNVHPLVNVSLLYYRRQCNGVYNNFVTDHNTLGATSNFHTLNERYQAYGHFLLQKHDDALNGGVLVIQDSIQFQKGTQPVLLESANYRRLSRAGSFRHFYRITKDTADARHQLQVYNGFIADYLI
ncbi:MAG TPA: putative porin, partial [Bacteroidia bacterium]|nr:putative porin [Bacteroidia bacterium]